MTHQVSATLGNGRPKPAERRCDIRNATVRFGERVVLRDVDLTIGPAARVAIIGDNGAGKSTLLGVIAGVVPLASGERRVELPGGFAVAEQRPVFPEHATVAEALDVLLADVRGLEAELRQLAEQIATAPAESHTHLLGRYALVVDQFEARDGYRVDLRVDAALEHLGLGNLDRGGLVAHLSGGERARLALAAALSAEAELLLLDEPTNDLDDAAIAWLEERLSTYRGALVVVTHDRTFLERFATDILALEDATVRRYGDGYQGYLAARAAERQRALERHRAWREDLARNQALIEANAFRLDSHSRGRELAVFGHSAFRARNRDHGAMSRIRIAKSRLATLLANPAPKPADPLRFTPAFDVPATPVDPKSADEPLVALTDVRLDPDIGPGLALDDLQVTAGDRWLVEGPNGAGKTTLLRVLAGELEPHAGTVWRRPGTRIVWLRQELASASDRTLLDAFASELGTYRDDAASVLLSLGLFSAGDLERPMAALSIGQQRRFEVAVAVSVDSELLLLDEPTNHLSPELTEQLETALESYSGAVITVTHDRRWRERAASHASMKRLWVDPGGIVSRPGRRG